MPIPEGAHYDPNNRQRVIYNNIRITRYEAENIWARQNGFDSHREYAQAVKRFKSMGMRYQTILRDGKSAGLTQRQILRYAATVNWRDNSPTGSKANFLAAIGRRPQNADWEVGATNGETEG